MDDETPLPTLVTSTGVATTTDPTDDSESGASTSSTGPSTTGLIPDFGEQDRDCNGEVDFLFVINRAYYMETYWERFHAAFPKFIDDVFETFASYDMHFMAIDGTQRWGMAPCLEQCELTEGSCAPIGPANYPCEPYFEESITDCDEMFGAGVVFPAGFGAANRDCGALEGRRFISTDQPDAVDAVKCIGQMGYGTSIASATTGMLQAVSHGTPAWQCNGGFLRDDAMLVVVYFEEPDAPTCTPSPPGEWAEIFKEAKSGNEDRLLFIGLIDDSSSDAPTVCPGGSGTYGTCPEEFLHYYVKHRIEGSYCADDYSPYFDAGLEMLEALCDPDVPT